jgi:hypothetical protein
MDKPSSPTMVLPDQSVQSAFEAAIVKSASVYCSLLKRRTNFDFVFSHKFGRFLSNTFSVEFVPTQPSGPCTIQSSPEASPDEKICARRILSSRNKQDMFVATVDYSLYDFKRSLRSNTDVKNIHAIKSFDHPSLKHKISFRVT